ncbi:MAG: primosomal protein N' [Bacteriovoracales bacterium]|nr:primosomal protein N' [Bacteriovoracales bacterium]
MMNYYGVAVNFPKVDSVLTYKSDNIFQVGDLVEVPLGPKNRKEKGLVVSCGAEQKSKTKEDEGREKSFEIKEILSLIDHFQIDHKLLELLMWMSRYYHYSLGKLTFDILPRFLVRPKKLNFFEGQGEEFEFSPNSVQKGIVKKIESQFQSGHSTHLIHGVTGSGKTTIYIELMRKIMEKGQSVLFLIPEINLTLPFLDLFKRHLKGSIYCYNSSVSHSDKFGLWKELENSDDPKLILGARSSVFLPLKNLGLIIIDEEHDLSFKQEDRCPYHARNIAIKRGKILNIPVVMGSATPSTEVLKLFEGNDEKIKRNYHRMKTRVDSATLPQINLIDMRKKDQRSDDQDYWPISLESIAEMKKVLNKGEQVLVFVNRLGYANYFQCRACGYQFFCKNCSVPLKYFKLKNLLKCQHCDYEEKVPVECPECYNLKLLQRGFGTEKVLEVIQDLFPDKTVKRFDREELKTMRKVEERLNEFHDGKIDILIGTQMLSKGHNFKRVNLVLVLGTDAQLSYPDFRSQEKAFQQIFQISGRAGRFGSEGKVLIQTFMPQAKIYTHLGKGDEDTFYREELLLRREYGYPPYSKMAMIYLHSKSSLQLSEDANRLGRFLESVRDKHFANVELHGPRMCNIEKRAGRFSQMILIKSESINQLHNLVETMRLNFKPRHAISFQWDIDPMNIL